MIDAAEPKDIDQIVAIGRQMWSESEVYSGYEWCDKKAQHMAYDHIHHPEKLLLVDRRDDKVVGFLFADIGDHFYGPAKMAREQLLYIIPEYRGGSTAVRFMKLFQQFGELHNCDILMFSQSAGGMDDRWDKFCQNLGYKPVGKTFFKDI
jgi:hypothetical protein